jgi:hypothetical protein
VFEEILLEDNKQNNVKQVYEEIYINE